MRIIIAKNATVIPGKHMGQQKREIIFHNLVFLVNPNFFPKDADTSSAPKPRLHNQYLYAVSPFASLSNPLTGDA